MFSKLPFLLRNLRSRVVALVGEMEAIFNGLTGSETQWWPFGFLRPEPEQRFSSARVATLAVLHGLPMGIFLVVFDGAARHAAIAHRLPVFLLIVCAALFATNRLTLAYFWNRRAARLARHRERFDTWKAGG